TRMQKNTGAVGPVTGAIKGFGARKLGEGKEAIDWNADLDQLRTVLTTLGKTSHLKAEAEALASSLPTNSNSERYTKEQLARIQERVGNLARDALGYSTGTMNVLPPHIMQRAQSYNLLPSQATDHTNIQILRTQPQTLTVDQLKTMNPDTMNAS